MREKPSCTRLCIDSGLGRWTYTVAFSCLVVTFIVQMILLGMIIVPYLQENQFMPANCRFITSRYGESQVCKNVADSDLSSFPCLIVRVSFTTLTPPIRSADAIMYLIFSYYSGATHNARCASRICYKDRNLNAGQVASLNTTMHNGGRNFTCYVRQEPNSAENSVLFMREFSESQVFHCILWPSLVFGCGVLLIWLVFCCVGCKVWVRQIS